MHHQGWTCPHCQQDYVVKDYVPPIPRHLLETNDPPLLSEEKDIKSGHLTTEIESDILQLEKEIKDLKHTLKALKTRRMLMEQSLMVAKGILSPIRRIPKEIIGEIILHATDDTVSLNTKDGAWAYAQVCRLWRLELLSCRSMWANVCVDDGKYPLRTRGAEIFHELLARSRQHPLHITIRLSVDTPISRDILALAVEESTTWRDAKLTLAPKLLPKLKKLKNRIPSLESLEVGHTSSQDIVSSHLANAFSVAPALRRVILNGLRDLDSLNLPWSQLSYFHDGSCTPQHTLDLLLRIPKLVEYTLNERMSHSPPQPTIVLHQLRSLRIGIGAGNQLSSFRLPALVELDVISAGSSANDVAALIQRSNCHITNLSLYLLTPLRNTRQSDQVLRILRVCPSVTTLWFRRHLPSGVLEELQRNVLPGLRTLIFSQGSFEKNKTAILSLADVWGKAIQSHCIHIAYDHGSGLASSEVYQQLQPYAGAGLTITYGDIEALRNV